MSANLKTRIIDNSVERNGGLVWHRLHSERAAVCEQLLPGSGVAAEEDVQSEGPGVTEPTAIWQREMLQSRLRKLDDALDRLMSGS
jgi:hypothetical protein